MKLAVSNLAWDKTDENLFLPIIKSMGISGIEVAPTKIWDNPASQNKSSIKKYAKVLEQKGFVIPSIQSVLFRHPELKIFSDLKTRKNTLLYLKKMIKLASWLEANVIVFGSPKNRQINGMDKKHAMDIAKNFFYDISIECEKNKIIFCLEANPRKYGADFIVNIEEAISLIKQVNNPYFRLNLDTGSLILNGEDISKSIQTASPFIAHVQISEPFLEPISNVREHKKISKALTDVKYNNWFSIEMLSNKYDKRLLIDSISKVKNIYDF